MCVGSLQATNLGVAALQLLHPQHVIWHPLGSHMSILSSMRTSAARKVTAALWSQDTSCAARTPWAET